MLTKLLKVVTKATKIVRNSNTEEIVGRKYYSWIVCQRLALLISLKFKVVVKDYFI